MIGILVYETTICQEKISKHIRIQVVTVSTVAAVLACFYYTGGFFQPLLASNRTFGCVGYFRPDIRAYEHILVYWIGPTFGAVLVTFVTPFIKQNCLCASVEKIP